MAKRPDFEAEITILPLGPDTRSTPARNGIRWAFAFPEDTIASLLTAADIWPIFIDANGEPVPDHVPLSGKMRALMHMMTLDWTHPYTDRIVVGQKFHMMEGSRVCATGMVSALFRPTELD